MVGIRLSLVLGVLVMLAPSATASDCGGVTYPGGSVEYPCDKSSGENRGDGGGWTSPAAQAFYGILGLLGSGSAAFFGWNRIRRRRKSLREVLREADETFAMSKNDPEPGIERLNGLRAELATRHQHAKIEDAQFLQLDGRISDYIVKLRIVSLERRFPELPLDLSRDIRSLVADGLLSGADVKRIGKRATTLRIPAMERAKLTQFLQAWADADAVVAPAARPAATVVVVTPKA